MSERLERRVYLTLVTLALCALILAAWPAGAQAQEGAAATQEAQATNRDAARGGAVVVEPGDSLWSMSEERLGPDASARRIARHTERLWALNRERIGSGNPDLILPGQELLVPPVGGPSVNQPFAAAPSARAAAGATDANESGEAYEPAAKLSTLPDAVAVQPFPAARPLISYASLPEDGHAKRRLLGSMLLMLSFGAASIFAFLAALKWWKRRAKRSIGEPLADEAYRRNYYAFFTPSLAETEEASRPVPAPTPVAILRGFGVYGGGALTERNRLTRTFASARRQRRRRKSIRRSRPLREGLATGAHNPEVRRCLQRHPVTRPVSGADRAKEPRSPAITRELANASKARRRRR